VVIGKGFVKRREDSSREKSFSPRQMHKTRICQRVPTAKGASKKKKKKKKKKKQKSAGAAKKESLRL